jgi:hypothetical protein
MENQTPGIPDLSENKFQQLGKEIQAQQQAQQPTPREQPQNNQVLIPPKQENNNELLIGVYLKKEQKTIDYYYNSEQLPLILFNKNVIIGMLENIKLDILIGENPKNE